MQLQPQCQAQAHATYMRKLQVQAHADYTRSQCDAIRLINLIKCDFASLRLHRFVSDAAIENTDYNCDGIAGTIIIISCSRLRSSSQCSQSSQHRRIIGACSMHAYLM